MLFREARRALERERGEKLDEDALLDAMCRAFLRWQRAVDESGSASSEDSSHPRGAESTSTGADAGAAASAGAPYRVAVTVCSECRRGWQHGGGAVEAMTPAAVECATCDAQWIGDVDSDEVERAHHAIPPATRRKVLHRDQNRCQAPGCRCYSNSIFITSCIASTAARTTSRI